MTQQEPEASASYKIHCLEIEMNELKLLIEGFKDHVNHFKILHSDFKEIRDNKTTPPSKIFLLKRYF